MSKLDQLRAMREAKAAPVKTTLAPALTAKRAGKRIANPRKAAAPSTHCPSCGKRLVAMTPAEKQKAYRERKMAARR